MSDSQKIVIGSHRQLIGLQREIFKRLNANPQLAALMLINPALALQDIGFKASREITHHMLHTLQHPPQLRQRREYLEQKLKQALQEKPRPNDAKWVKKILFVKLQIQPLNTQGLTPQYIEPIDSQAIERLQALRPKPRGQRYQEASASAGGTAITLMPVPARVRRLDLDAVLPELQPTNEILDSIGLETLYFYKDSHPLVRDVLELGIIQQQSFPIQTADSYRQIKKGKKNNAFYAWIDEVHFPVNTNDPKTDISDPNSFGASPERHDQ